MDCHTPTVLSLCTGAGGLELGLKLAVPGCRTVCYVEGEAYAASILAARMEDQTLDAAPVWSDVRTFDSGAWRGCVDIITAGYPCQPFSIAGRKQAERDPRHLWPYIRDIVAELRPRIAFFENVSHHLRLGFQQVHDDLRSLGYGVKTGLFTAEEVGAPHKRERLFILAHAEGAGAWLDQLDTRQGVGGDGPPLADPARIRNVGAAENLFKAQRRPDGQGPRLPHDSGQGVADAGGAGLEGQPRYEGPGHQAGVPGEYGLPLWPPGPGALDTWGAVQNALKPAIHRMADGMADRVDRIRLCGNGVVPLAAAYAFRTLASHIES